MIIAKARIEVQLEQTDRLLMEGEGNDSYALTVTNGNGNPVRITNISRKQLLGLLNGAQRVVMAYDEEKVAGITLSEFVTEMKAQ